MSSEYGAIIETPDIGVVIKTVYGVQNETSHDNPELSHPPISHSMPLYRRLYYSVGHILNDIAASMWFTYFLLYLHIILKFDAVLAGYLILLGQITDGICTPLIGYESDRTKGFCKLGRRKSWYLVGCICVASSFPFLYNPCIDGLRHSSEILFIYYAPFVVIFQFGWAATQISHLSLIPDLTDIPEERVELNSLRYGCTVLSNIFVYAVAWLLLAYHHSPPDHHHVRPTTFNTLQPSDTAQFRLLVFIALGVGLIFVAIFFFGTKEERSQKRLCVNDETSSTHTLPETEMKWTSWLKEPQFYKVGVLYMCARLYTNVSQIYLPMYIINTILLGKESIAIVPLIVFASSFVASLSMKRITGILGLKVTYFVGSVIGAGACIGLFLIESQSRLIYMIACIVGFGGSTMLVTALSMIASLISGSTETGAFVYGAMSFVDKVSNGIAIVVIQNMHPPMATQICIVCSHFYRYAVTCVPAGAVGLSLIALSSLGRSSIGTRRAKDPGGAVSNNDRLDAISCSNFPGEISEETSSTDANTHEKETLLESRYRRHVCCCYP